MCVLEHEVEHVEDAFAVGRLDISEEFEAVEHGFVAEGLGGVPDEVVEGNPERARDRARGVDGRTTRRGPASEQRP